MGIRSRLSVGVLAAALAVGITAAPGGAESFDVTGEFTGTGTLTVGPCAELRVDGAGSGEWTDLGTTSFTFQFCMVAPETTIVDGRFTITTADGTMSGVMTGTVDAYRPFPEIEYPFHLTLDVGSGEGTGRFADATGVLVLDGSFGAAAALFSGTVAGTIETPGSTPTSRDDCKHGGWRDLVDHDGIPFANPGRCVAWAGQHT